MEAGEGTRVFGRFHARLDALSLYTGLISAMGAAVLVWSIVRVGGTLPQLLVFIGLIALAELSTTGGFLPQMVFSVSMTVTFAALLLFGPLAAALGSMAGGASVSLISELRDRRSGREAEAPLWQRLSFNMAAYGIAVLAGGLVFERLGGVPGTVARWGNVLPMLAGAATIEVLNALLVVGAVSLQTHQPAYAVWLRNVSWASPINVVAMMVGGGGIALGYTIAGALGLSVFLMPVGIVAYAFQLYVRQTKEQMARLEGIIAERTESLSRANEELKRLDRDKSAFFSMVNHEMRSPLTGILGYAELMDMGGRLGEEDTQLLAGIRSCGQRLLDLVNNILDASRLEEGRMDLVQSDVDIFDALDQALAVVKPQAEDKQLTVRVEIPQDFPLLWADPKRLSQILINLLTNAVKYTPEEGRVTISGYPLEESQFALLKVADTGIGIPKEQLPRIFDRFSRIERKEIQHTMGTGLGLSIVKGLVEAHGGRIRVRSEEGQGTTFFFTMPTCTAVADEPEAE